MSENFLRVMNLEYFLPAEMQEEVKATTPRLANGEYDYVAALYSNVSVEPSPDGTYDPYNVSINNDPHDMKLSHNVT